jgi:hypothetical protein
MGSGGDTSFLWHGGKIYFFLGGGASGNVIGPKYDNLRLSFKNIPPLLFGIC